MDPKIDVMIDEDAVEARIAEIAQQLSKEYEGKTIHIIGVLKGSVFFMCELAKKTFSTGYYGLYVCFQLWK